MGSENVSCSAAGWRQGFGYRFFWLTLHFEKLGEEHPLGKVYIDWLDKWKIEDYK